MFNPMIETKPSSIPSAAARREEAWWTAVRRRDPSYDGAFFFAVRTTGVYCRPSCASRAAKRENVSFYSSAEAAERAGYRACKRCRPDKLGAPDPKVEAVKRACERIAAAEEAPSLGDLAARAGMSPFHFHRVFKKVTGVTPKAYAAQTQARRAADGLRTAETITEAIYDAGFNSSSRFYENAEERTCIARRQQHAERGPARGERRGDPLRHRPGVAWRGAGGRDRQGRVRDHAR